MVTHKFLLRLHGDLMRVIGDAYRFAKEVVVVPEFIFQLRVMIS